MCDRYYLPSLSAALATAVTLPTDILQADLDYASFCLVLSEQLEEKTLSRQ